MYISSGFIFLPKDQQKKASGNPEAFYKRNVL